MGSACFTEYLNVIFKIVFSKTLYFHINFKIGRYGGSRLCRYAYNYDAIFKNGGYMNVSKAHVYIVVYRYPPSYLISSTSLLDVTYRYCDICIENRHLLKWLRWKPKNSKTAIF